MAAPVVPDPTMTVAFLFSDIEGSTRLEQAVGTQAYAELRERHRVILRAAFNAEGGDEQSTEGDSFFVVFPTARSAVVAAVRAQRGLVTEPWPSGAPIRVRMGIHAGQAERAGGSLVGLDINRAARIAALASGGQILASAAIRVLVGDALPDDVRLRDAGRHRLRDLNAPVDIVQVDADGLASDFPPLRSLDARPNNLPTQLTTFVGRDHELAEAQRLLEGSRLLTLTGPGGTGKTRLSLQLAAAVADRHPDGVFFVALEPIRDPTLVVSRIATTVGLMESGTRSAMDVLGEWLAGKRVLFVLDNFEQVVAAAPTVAAILRASATVTIVVTSRASLRIAGEQEYPVPGLPAPPDFVGLSGYARAQLPAGGREIDLTTLGQYESVRLFIARAVAVRPAFQVTNENAPAVAAICARLKGMPLAIELAAARIKLLSPEAILARLEHQLAILASAARDLPERQQTLRGAIAWSYDLLDDGGRLLLDRLSVFVGGAGLEAADAICGPQADLGQEILDGLTALVDQSLVRSEESTGEPRFRLLETIREFAAEHLAGRGEAEAILDRRATWYLDFAERAAAALAGSEQRTWLDRVEAEHDNLRAVVDRAIASGDAALAIRIGFALWRFWQKRGHLPEARRRFEAMAAEPWSRADPVLQARLEEALGGVCWWQADLAQMAAHYRAALDLWRVIGERREIANATYNYSFAFLMSPDPGQTSAQRDPDGEGLRLLEEAHATFREVGDDVGVANTLWAIGNYYYFRGESAIGVDRFREALDLFRTTGDRTMEAWALHMLGTGLLRLGRHDESRECLDHAIRHFHEASDAAGVTMVLDDHSSLAVAEGDLPRAARLRGAARNLTRETGVALASFVEEKFEEGVRLSVRGKLASEDLARYEAEGAALSFDEAVAYALRIEPSSLATPHAP